MTDPTPPAVTAVHTRIRTARAEGLGVITLARPEKKNALDRQTAIELVDALHELAVAEDVRVVIVEGDGDDFCAGADLAALDATLDAGSDTHLDDARALGRVFTTIREMAKPVVAIVRGRALAGGAGLATACDLVLAEESAEFGYPEVRIGFVPAMVMTMLRRAVGEKRAAELVLTGRIISATEAAQIGLISRCIPTAAFPSEVARTIEALVKAPPTAIGLTKRLLYRMDDLDFAQSIGVGVITNVESRATDDFRAGVRRFLDRSRPS
ncbi:MAG TPA: enoyl-CoA hydratase/isomerase family protein [Gemmatimonadaceae bacterium]|nr:enoyl-CoA hydratase/isomerase family protein [Gemmatimonadaceae bacterium]